MQIGWDKLPEKLHVQMDNTKKDNRNNIVYGFLASLVDRGFLQEVELSFLPIGHTHEDIDAFFSRIAKQVKTKKCLTIDDLANRIRASSQQTQVTVQVIEKVIDVAAWILPSCRPWKEDKNPALHINWFRKEGAVYMKSRLNAGKSTLWVPEGGHLFYRSLISVVPPSYALPKFRDVTKLRTSMDAIKEHLLVGTPTAYDTWMDELKRLESDQNRFCGTCLDLLRRISHVNPKKGTGKKLYNRMMGEKKDLQRELELHRASGCSDVQRVNDFPLLCESKLPLRKFVPVPVHTQPIPSPEKAKTHKQTTLTAYVHRQFFTKHLAGLKTRKNELNAGDLVAVLGASWEQPYRILKCVDFEDEQPDGKKYFRFQWLWQNEKDGWDLYEDIHRDLIGFATFLHWGFELKGKRNQKVREHDVEIIMQHDLMHQPTDGEEKEKKENKNEDDDEDEPQIKGDTYGAK